MELVDSFGNLVDSDSVNIPAGNPTYTASVSWNLIAGQQYYLLQTLNSNGLYVSWGAAAPSDAEIAITDTGVFSISLASANFSFGGAAGSGNAYWADFQNITTTPANSGSAVPEPASFILILPFAAAVLLRARWGGSVDRSSSTVESESPR